MFRSRFPAISLLVGGIAFLSAGCPALSFGGKTQTVDHVVAESPETIKRINHLESRVNALEQQLGPQLSLPEERTELK